MKNNQIKILSCLALFLVCGVGCSIEAPSTEVELRRGSSAVTVGSGASWQDTCYATGSATWTEDSGHRACVCSNEGGALTKTCTQALPSNVGECSAQTNAACEPGVVPFMCEGKGGMMCRCDSDQGRMRCAPPTPDNTGMCGADEFLDCSRGSSESCMMGPDKACTCDQVDGVPTLVCGEGVSYEPPVGLLMPTTLPGSMTLTSQVCANPPQGPKTCEVYEVSCGDEAPVEVELLVSPADPMVRFRGTVILGSGGEGNLFYNEAPVIDGLNQRGFRTVERRWIGPTGWLEGEFGLASVACRLDTVIEHVEQAYSSEDSPLCATGSSGGALELEMALFHGTASYRLDFAMPTGGGAFSLTEGCFPTSGSQWDQDCHALAAQHLAGCSSTPIDQLCGLPSKALSYPYPDNLECQVDDPLYRSRLGGDSLDTLNLTLPHTAISFMIGMEDCSGAATHGLALADAVGSTSTDTTLNVIYNAPHQVHKTPDGHLTIFDQFDRHCIH